MARKPLIAAGVAAASVMAAAFWFYFQYWAGLTPARLLSHLPQSRIIAGLDLRTLRAAGIIDLLGGGNSGEEPDYKQFVTGTGFDYKRDLDLLLLAYTKEETLALAQGRFDWARIQAYAKNHGGACEGAKCRLPSSFPERRISLLRLRAGTLALASSSDPDAADKIRRPVTGASPESTPRRPLWFRIPPATLKDSDSLPSGTRMFATALADADELTVSIDGKENRFEALLEASCRTPDQAAQAKRELEAATTLLKRLIAREHKEPNARDLSGVLTRGEFRVEGTRLTGTWPIERAFLESIGGAGQ